MRGEGGCAVFRRAGVITVVGVFLIGCAFLLVVGCADNMGSQPTGSQKGEVSQSAEAGSERTGPRESESTHEVAEHGGSQASGEGESTHQVVLHGESIEKAPNYPYGFLLKVNGITYDNPYTSETAGTALHDEDLGPKLAEVNVEGNEQSASSTTKGQAASNEVPVYAIKGYDTFFRVAVRMDDRLMTFEVLSNPKAEEGADILDIGGKVRSTYSSAPGKRGYQRQGERLAS